MIFSTGALFLLVHTQPAILQGSFPPIIGPTHSSPVKSYPIGPECPEAFCDAVSNSLLGVDLQETTLKEWCSGDVGYYARSRDVLHTEHPKSTATCMYRELCSSAATSNANGGGESNLGILCGTTDTAFNLTADCPLVCGKVNSEAKSYEEVGAEVCFDVNDDSTLAPTSAPSALPTVMPQSHNFRALFGASLVVVVVFGIASLLYRRISGIETLGSA
mmetsp:Transcript_70824/g.139187  ORF Transcript_70824/g.139187 Transcript_70824/m.139187 type:complete len:218 (-) Transcript_70824:224-877(-)